MPPSKHDDLVDAVTVALASCRVTSADWEGLKARLRFFEGPWAWISPLAGILWILSAVLLLVWIVMPHRPIWVLSTGTVLGWVTLALAIVLRRRAKRISRDHPGIVIRWSIFALKTYKKLPDA